MLRQGHGGLGSFEATSTITRVASKNRGDSRARNGPLGRPNKK